MTQLATFQAAEAQLRPWLMEKELMMSVLGPLSIDPNMLSAQKQQVQVRGGCVFMDGGERLIQEGGGRVCLSCECSDVQ